MNNFQQVGVHGVGGFVKITDLPQGEPYEVSLFSFTTTRFGERILATLKNGQSTILPKRFADAVDNNQEQLNWLNSTRYNMVFRGIDINRKNMVIVEFNKIE